MSLNIPKMIEHSGTLQRIPLRETAGSVDALHPELLMRTMEESGIPDPESLDKSYWISRVGDVSFKQKIHYRDL